jgi:hypothetical protein
MGTSPQDPVKASTAVSNSAARSSAPRALPAQQPSRTRLRWYEEDGGLAPSWPEVHSATSIRPAANWQSV